MVQRAGQNLQILIEKVEILFGNRGNQRDWALRRGELVDVQKIIADVRKSLDDLKKALQQVKSDIDEINATIGVIEGRLDSAEQAINDLNAELDALLDRITNAESALTQLEADIQSVNGQIGQIGGDIQSVQLDIMHLESDVSGIKTTIESIDANITDIEGDINTLSGQVSTLNTQMSGVLSELQTVFAFHTNPGATPFTAAAFRAIPFFTPVEATGVTLTGSNAVFTVSKAGLYQFEVEIRVNGGAANMPPLGTNIGISLDTTTTPTSFRVGFGQAQDTQSRTIMRLVCTERLAAGAQRSAYFYNSGSAAYQVASGAIKIVRLSA